MNKISNVEFALLQLIAESSNISGYEINKLVEERGYREWADIGTTSIYVGLDKLSKKELVESQIDTNKTGKGPLPKRFTLTQKGKNVLRDTIIESLSLTRERDHRFDLAVAAIPFISSQEAVDALNRRKSFLLSEQKRLEGKFHSQGGYKLPFFVRALFAHPLALIDAEIKFTNQLVTDLTSTNLLINQEVSMEKIDYKKKLKELYNPSAKKVTAVNVPKMNFLMVDGQGDPGKAKEFQEAIEALFSVSYNLKFKIKKSKAIDYGVMPLEGLWWSEDMEDFIKGARDKWKWTLMIMQPEFITQELVKEAISEVEKKKNLPALSKMRFESYEEGLSAQIMHIGPFSEEGPNIQRIHKYIEEQGKKLRGEHHEIYLSDFRKVAPEKMKTVLRQPMA